MIKKQSKEWHPHPGPQTEAFRFFYVYELLYGGAKGGGKTDWLLFDYTHPKLIKKANYRGIIFRRTFPRLREIIDRSHLWFNGTAKWSGQDKCWTFPSGAKLYFGHCQYEESKYDYQGQEYHYMGFDQLEEFTEAQYEFLKVQARSTDTEIPIRIRATANPGNVGHLWVKNRFIDNKEPLRVYKDNFGLSHIFIPAKVYDNPSLMDNDPLYVKRLESLPEQERKALLDGDWNIFAGQFFRQWSQKIIQNISISESYIKFCSLDYGYKNPSSIGWWAIDYDGNIIRYRELYQELLTYEQLAERFAELTGGENIEYIVADPSIWGDRSHHKGSLGESGYETLVRMLRGIMGENAPIILKADNNRINGWIKLREYMENEKIFCWDNCVNSIRTIPALIHDERRVEDVDTDGEDHCADEWRYAVMSRISPTEKEKVLFNTTRGKKNLEDSDPLLQEVFNED